MCLIKWDAEKYDSSRAPQIDTSMKIIAVAGVKEADSILGIECGTGMLSIEITNLASLSHVTGIDS